MHHIQDHQVAQLRGGVSAAPQTFRQTLLDLETSLQHNLLPGNSFRSQDRVLRAFAGNSHFLFWHHLARAADSRTVI
jgi:hypothetical protein